MRSTACRKASGAFLFVFLVSSLIVAQNTMGEFTIVALPDTQIYSKSYPQIHAAQTQWIADHKSDMNIQLVVGLGDIVDAGGRTYQWQNADAAYRTLDGLVPYMVAIGNHDYDANNPSGRTAYAKNFNNYFGPPRYSGKSYYGGSYPTGSNENFYGVVTLGGKPYLILVLEVFPRDQALSWAAGILRAHADKPAILVTHAFTYYDNMRMSKCDSNSSYSFGVGNDNDGEDIWTKLASQYSNIVMVLSGHVVQGDGTGRRADIGVNGNLVNQILADFQNRTNGGNGYLRIMTFKPALNQVVVKTYSPYVNKWLTDSHNQFTVPLQLTSTWQTAGAITGKVKSAVTCDAMAGVTVTAGGTTTVTDAYGKFTIPGSGPAAYATTAQKSGWGANTKLASIVPGQASPAKFLVASSGQLKGTVTSANGALLGGATITLKGGALKIVKTMTSDSKGNFSSGWIPVGDYSVMVTRYGYSGWSGSATVASGLTTTLKATIY